MKNHSGFKNRKLKVLPVGSEIHRLAAPVFSLLLMVSLLITGSLSLTGCEVMETEQPRQGVRIGIAIYDQYDLFLSALISEFNEYSQQQSTDKNLTITVDLVNAAASQSTQNSQVKEMLQDDYDVLCVNLVDRTDAGTIIEMASDYDKPIIFFNRELVENDLKRSSSLYYVGGIVEEAGKRQGELAASWYEEHPEMDKNQDGKLQYIILEGEPTHQDAISRTNECVKALEAEEVQLDKVSFTTANWSRDQAKTKVEQLLDSGQELELILANNDAMALGAIDAYKDYEIDQAEWPAIFGIDGIEEGLEAVKEGTMQATVANDYVDQADAMLDLALALSGENSMDDLTWKPDGNRCIRTEYRNVTGCDTCDTGYVIWDTTWDLHRHQSIDQDNRDGS